MKKGNSRGKPLFRAKKLGKRERRLARKVAGDPKRRRKLFDALAAALAANRATYFDLFLSTWEQATASLNAAVDAVLASPDTRLGADQFDSFAHAWDPIQLQLFMRLADRLTEHEARVFRLRVDRLAVAWSSFAAALLMRRPDLRDAIERLRAAAVSLGEHVADIFLGELPPQLDDGYATLFRGYSGLVDRFLAEGGRGQ